MHRAVLAAVAFVPAAFAVTPGDYAGAEACRACHAAEFASQSATAHAQALAHSTASQRGDWSFGAGMQAITFVTRIAPDSYREDGLSWYRSLNGDAVTPGQHDDKGVVFRTFDPAARILSCFA
jgi:ADP-ribosylglycohydrolase